MRDARRRRQLNLTGDDDYEPTYRWAVVIIAATIVCFVLGALAMLAAIRLGTSIGS